MVVQQHVLNWLYSVLTSEYHNVNRTYNDVAQALSKYPSLSPRTDVHTFDNGVSALLVHLTGTIPVVFRGATYRFPVSVWVPHAYPREAPLAYVTPTESMTVRPGQHVDPQGRIYHPYLAAWPEFWDKSSLLDFLAILRDIFAKEPPVVARQPTQPPSHPQSESQSQPQQPQQPQPQHQQQQPPLPPPQQAGQPPVHTSTPYQSTDDRPPPPPPKGDGPPLPPLPPGIHREPSLYRQQTPSAHGSPIPSAQSPADPQVRRASRYDSAPPLPTQQPQQPQKPPHQHPQPPAQQLHQQHTGQFAAQGSQQYQYHPGPPQPAPLPPQDFRRPSVVSTLNQYQFPGQHQQAPHQGQPAPGPPYGGAPPPGWQPQPPAHVQPKPKPPPPPDIMDQPLTVSLPSPSNLPPPPIPLNPEKDALLRQLASTLHALRQRARQQNESSLAGLTAQRNAMLAALQNLQNDSAALTPMSAMLSSNTAILQSSLKEADDVIRHSKTQPPPDIDDLLVAPSVVGNQLYNVVAEERALGDAIFVLGRAVERGRISPAVFAKTTRSLAREWYLKKALVEKITAGMGLSR